MIAQAQRAQVAAERIAARLGQSTSPKPEAHWLGQSTWTYTPDEQLDRIEREVYARDGAQ